MLQFIHNNVWKMLFGKQADGLQKSTDDEDEYRIIENSPITNRYIPYQKVAEEQRIFSISFDKSPYRIFYSFHNCSKNICINSESTTISYRTFYRAIRSNNTKILNNFEITSCTSTQ